MRNHHRTRFAVWTAHKIFRFLLVSALALAYVSPAAAQKEKKKKPDASQSADNKMLVPMTDEQQIDYTLSEMLGAWQLGDIEKLHSDYADDVVVVNGSWAPPVFGWNNYLATYQQQHARMERIRMDRLNTYIKVSGTVGWACYQWDFEAIVDGQQMQSQGQTSLVLEKRNNHWVIALNHTSISPRPLQPTPASAPSAPQQPAKPAPR